MWSDAALDIITYLILKICLQKCGLSSAVELLYTAWQ